MGGLLFVFQHSFMGNFIWIQVVHVQQLRHGDLLGGIGNGADLRVAVGGVEVLGRAFHNNSTSTYVQLDISFHIQGLAALVL